MIKRSSILKHFTFVTRALFLNFIKKIYITVTLSLEKKCINFICFSLPQRAATTFNIPTYKYPIHLSILQNTINRERRKYTACAFGKQEFALRKKKGWGGARRNATQTHHLLLCLNNSLVPCWWNFKNLLFFFSFSIYLLCHVTAQSLSLPESFKGSRKAHYGHESANTVLSRVYF